MACLNRRNFLKAGVLAGVGLELGALGPTPWWGASAPALSIAHYKQPPTDPEGIAEEARRLTRAAIDALGGMGRFVSKGHIVWVKPNMAFNRPPEYAVATNPHVIGAIVEMCYQAGAAKVLISDCDCTRAGPCDSRTQIQQVADKAGGQFVWMDKKKFRKMSLQGKFLKDWEVYTEVVEADRLINVPIAKDHSLTRVTLGMKNLMGVVGGERVHLHNDFANALADLAAFFHPQLVVVDAIRVLAANGPAGGRLVDVRRKDTVIAGTDQVAVDAWGATLMGHPPESIGYIAQANARGLGTINYASLSPPRLEL